jgi:hypothetical protein
MKKWSFRLVLAALLIGVGLWSWRAFFPNPDRAVRRRLAEAAQLASFAPNEGPAAKLINSQKLASFATPDITVHVDVPGYEHSFSGSDELASRLLAVRQMPSLSVRLFDIVLAVAPDGQSAVAHLTVRARAGGDSDLIVQELKVALKKSGLEWRVNRVETVKTLR